MCNSVCLEPDQPICVKYEEEEIGAICRIVKDASSQHYQAAASKMYLFSTASGALGVVPFSDIHTYYI